MKINNEHLKKITGGINIFVPFLNALERMIRVIHIRYLMYVLFVD